MKTRIFVLTAIVFAIILFTVSCVADDPADTSVDVSRSESMPQEESVNESTPPEESKPAEESKLEESIPPEESKPEESKPAEESKPTEESERELAQEKIKADYQNDVSILNKKMKQGYTIEYGNYTVKYCAADNSIYVNNGNEEYNYYDKGIHVCIPYDTYTAVSIKKADYETFSEWIKPITDEVNSVREALLQQILEAESDIAFSSENDTIIYRAKGDYLHSGKYKGTVSTIVRMSNNVVRITATYQYEYKTNSDGKTRNESFTKTYYVKFTTDSAKEHIKNNDKVLKTYEFENLEEYKAFAEKLYDFYGSVYKLSKNSLNKAIYADYRGTDSTDGDYYIIEKTVAVGTNDNFVKASKTNYYRLPGELYKFDSYAYTTEESYDYRRIWEGFNYNNPDYEYGAAITGEDNKSDAKNRLYSNLHSNVYYDDDFFTYYLSNNGGELKTDIKNFAIIAGRFDSITYTANDDGTVTVNFTCVNNESIHSLLFGMELNINSKWMHKDNAYDYTAFLTYDAETGLMTSLSINCKATKKDGFWYDHKLEVTVTDADESMLPEKAELLEGKW